MVIDGQGATFTFDGVEVGGVQNYTFSQPDSRDVPHRPLASTTTEWLPGQISYGLVTLSLYRNDSDDGQDKMVIAHQQRRTVDCVLTLKNGATRTFRAFVRAIPTVGGVDGVVTGAATLRISGGVNVV